MDNQIRVKRFTGSEEECNTQLSEFLDVLKKESKGKAFGIIDVAQGVIPLNGPDSFYVSILYHLVSEPKVAGAAMILPNRGGIN